MASRVGKRSPSTSGIAALLLLSLSASACSRPPQQATRPDAATPDGAPVDAASDGWSWSIEPAPTQETLLNVWGAPGGAVYAAGMHGALIHKEQDARWVSDHPATAAHLTGVRGSAAGLFVGGVGYCKGDGCGSMVPGGVFQLRSGQWQLIGDQWASAILARGDDLYALVDRNIERWSARTGEWASEKVPDSVSGLSSAWDDADALFAGSWQGQILRSSGDGTWQLDGQFKDPILAIAGDGEGLYATTYEYSLLTRQSAGTWSVDSTSLKAFVGPAFAPAPVGLCSAAQGELFVGFGGDFARAGLLVHRDSAGNWTRIDDLGRLPPLYSLWCSPDGRDVYGVGQGGLVLHGRR